MNNRESNYAGHPPYCTCVECVNCRLRNLAEKDRDLIESNPRDYYKGGTHWARLIITIGALGFTGLAIWLALTYL